MLLALACRTIPGARTIDDAYITFRYARSILAGSGFVYNIGEHVLGTTTPLYTLIIAALGAITGGVDAPFPQIALWFNAAADMLTCWLLWRIGLQIKAGWAGLLAGTAWSLAPFSVSFAIGGMETSLYILCLTSMIWAYNSNKMISWGAAAGLAFLTRPDALILIGMFVLHAIIRLIKRGLPNGFWRGAALAAVMAAVWLGFAWFYFGSPLPHSLLAKSVAYKLDSYEGLVRLLQHYADPFMDESTFGSLGTKYGIILYPFLAMAGSISAIRAKKEAWAWIGYPWIYLSVFAFFNPLIFRWYLAPPLPVYFLMIFLGAGNLLQIIIQKVNDSSRNSSINIVTKSFRILAAAAPMFLLLNAWTLTPDHGPRNPAPEMSFIKLELLYQQAAEILLPNLKPDSVLAAGDVGVLGYITGKQVLDTVGLNSLEASAYYPADPLLYTINYAIPPRLILDYRPEFLVMLEVYGRNGLMIDEQFLERYDLLADIPTDMYGSDGLLIFQRSNRAQGL